MIDTRYELAMERIRLIAEEDTVHPAFRDYFRRTAGWFVMLADGTGESPEERNRALYGDLLSPSRETAYENPAYAIKRLGKGPGPLLSALSAEIRTLPVLAAAGSRERVLIRMELFLEIYHVFETAFREKEGSGRPGTFLLRDRIGMAMADYAFEEAKRDLEERQPFASGPVRDLLMQADLTDPSCLYAFGLPVSEEDLSLAGACLSMTEKEADRRAGALAGRFLSSLTRAAAPVFCVVSWQLGTERVVRKAVRILEEEGVICGLPVRRRSLFGMGGQRRGLISALQRSGFWGDHERDRDLFYHEPIRARVREGREEAVRSMEAAAPYAGEAAFQKALQ